VVTLPTPCARDGKGPGHQYGLPDLIEAGRSPAGLLPTPTSGGGTGYMSGNRRDTWRPTLELAVQGYRPSKDGRPDEPEVLLPTPTASPYGSNQSLSAGAAVRPSLATLASQRLLPTPTVADARSAANATAGRRGDTTAHPGTTLTDAARLLPIPLAADGRRQDHHMAAGNLTLLGAAVLLPTPRTSDGRGPAEHGAGGADLRTAVWLLPTPKASDGTKGCPAQRGSKGDLTLPSAAVRLDTGQPDRAGDLPGPQRLLPTPRVAATRTGRRAATAPDSRSSPSLEQAAEIAGGVLPRELGSWGEAPAAWQPPSAPAQAGRAWGPYADAVGRWELLLGRPAPAPTQPGKHGKPVLAPPFVEWLMGLDAGWVTDLALPRTLALRVLGNGVVPQQAAVALRLLLCPHRWAVRS